MLKLLLKQRTDYFVLVPFFAGIPSTITCYSIRRACPFLPQRRIRSGITYMSLTFLCTCRTEHLLRLYGSDPQRHPDGSGANHESTAPSHFSLAWSTGAPLLPSAGTPRTSHFTEGSSFSSSIPHRKYNASTTQIHANIIHPFLLY